MSRAEENKEKKVWKILFFTRESWKFIFSVKQKNSRRILQRRSKYSIDLKILN